MESKTKTDISKFNNETTALQAIAGISLAGRVAIVTGAASGIGTETARGTLCVVRDRVLCLRVCSVFRACVCTALAHAGAQVILAVRDPCMCSLP